jgi:hypothetical protein
LSERKKALSKVNLELERLKTLDQELIAKKNIYEDKLKLAVKRGKITLGESKEKMSDFNEKYLEHRVKVGQKRLEYYTKKNELIGRTQLVKLDTTQLNDMLSSI